MKKYVIAFLIFCTSLSSFASQDNNPTQMAETFLSTLLAGDTSTAYDQLFKGSIILETKPQAADMLKRQTEAMVPMYGKILGYDLVTEEKFGDSVVRLVYVLKQEKHPTGWEFFFYKPQGHWFLSNIKFNDQFEVLQKMK